MNNRHPDLNAYLDGELSSRQRQAVEDHLRVCEPCRQTLGELEALRQLLHDVKAPAPRFAPASFAARVSQRLPGQRRAKRSGPVLGPMALAFLVWSAVAAFLRLANGLLTIPDVKHLLPKIGNVWWINLLHPLADIPVVQMISRVVTLGGWLGWDDWAFVAFSLFWAVLSAGLLALDWAWTRHQMSAA